jgi:hypothetical protein
MCDLIQHSRYKVFLCQFDRETIGTLISPNDSVYVALSKDIPLPCDSAFRIVTSISTKGFSLALGEPEGYVLAALRDDYSIQFELRASWHGNSKLDKISRIEAATFAFSLFKDDVRLAYGDIRLKFCCPRTTTSSIYRVRMDPIPEKKPKSTIPRTPRTVLEETPLLSQQALNFVEQTVDSLEPFSFTESLTQLLRDCGAHDLDALWGLNHENCCSSKKRKIEINLNPELSSTAPLPFFA